MFKILNADLTPSGYLRFIQGKPWVHRIRYRGKEFMFDTNSLCALELDPALAETLRDRANAPDSFQGLLYSPQTPQYPFMPTTVQTMVLAATRRCNLRCRYCFVENLYDKDTHAEIDMSVDTAKTAIRCMFDGSKVTQIGLGFFGGEPLMNKSLLFEIVPWAKEYAAKRGKTVRFSCTTNAVDLDERVARLFAENDFGLIISLDGNEKIHDYWRPLDGGLPGSHKATVQGIMRLKDAHYSMGRITLRSTYTGQGADLMERVPYLIENFVDRGLAGHVSVEPSCLTESSCVGFPEMSDMAFDMSKLKPLFEAEYMKLADYFVERLNAGKGVPFHHFRVMIQRLLWGCHSPTECGAGKGYVDVSPEGDIYPCHREQGDPIGSIHAGGIDEAKRAMWMDNRWYVRERCGTCWLRNICGGGCRIDSVLAYGNVKTPDPISCWFKRTFFRNVLWIIAMVDGDKLRRQIPNPKLKQVGSAFRQPQPRKPKR